MYRARVFAELAGVTVRTLHHYDRLGLLKPTRSSNGYRLYDPSDLERLEQIAALKFLGMPLAQIRRVLQGPQGSLAEELARQRGALIEKRRLLDLALLAIEDAEAAVHQGKTADALLRRIVQVINMQNDNNNWMMRYYSPAAQEKIAQKAASFTPEMQEEISRAWKQYYRDVKTVEQEGDPDGSKTAELAERHKELVAAFTGNDAEVEAGLAALYKDRQSWPDEMKRRMTEYESE